MLHFLARFVVVKAVLLSSARLLSNFISHIIEALKEEGRVLLVYLWSSFKYYIYCVSLHRESTDALIDSHQAI